MFALQREKVEEGLIYTPPIRCYLLFSHVGKQGRTYAIAYLWLAVEEVP